MTGTARGLRQDPKALGLSGVSEALIEADEIVVSRAAVRPQESGGQLQSDAQRMQDECASRSVPHLMAGQDLGPVST